MCGIAGFYGFRNDNLIKKFSKELEHRGPDGEGFYIDENVTLLNRRLAIIDLKTGDQPIYNEDESLVTVYNGEIYNYQELRAKLEKLGHKFKTKADTEVIVHGYEQWGEKCFDKFNGMFAIALYDKKKKKLILVRDHFGIKPLYYALNHANKNNLIFASEIKPIIDSGLIKKKPNDRVIYRYLRYRVHDDLEETFFQGVNRLRPGEMLIIRNSRFVIRKFSNLEQELLTISRSQQFSNLTIEQFKKELTKAIKYRLISDVPVGTSFSGGLDSSTIVAVVNKLLLDKNKVAQRAVGKKQKTFSAIFPGSRNDEEKYINELLKNLSGIENYKTIPKPEEFFEEIGDFVKTQEEPTISTGPYAQFRVMKMAHNKVKVLLDGQGTDEMMAGYLPYYFVYLRQLIKEGKYSRFFTEFISSGDIILKSLVKKTRTVSVRTMLNKNFADKFQNERFVVCDNNLRKRLVDDIFRHSLQSLLRYEDRNSMRFSIEGRVPFLDFNLMRYIFSLSDEAIIKNGWNKYILRESVRDLLPELIYKRRNKIGFTTPETEWFIRMKNKIYEIFSSESFGKRKYFNQRKVLEEFKNYISGKNDDTLLFWRLLNVELWLRIFFDPPQGQKSHRSGVISPGIEVNGKKYLRMLIKTDMFKKGDNYVNKISNYVFQYINTIKQKQGWFVVVSEKIVAISQGRSYFLWEINPGLWANFLSKYVRRTPYGIGLGSPWTMQLAIREVGLFRILTATILSALTKPFGIKGIFYHIAGREVASIDGPTEYSVYPSNVSAKLGPKQPQEVARKIQEAINSKFQISNFLGVVIIDANDLGRDVLGNSTELDNALIEEIFRDNPMGQGREQTPITLVIQV